MAGGRPDAGILPREAPRPEIYARAGKTTILIPEASARAGKTAIPEGSRPLSTEMAVVSYLLQN